jgi:hypothetical protein
MTDDLCSRSDASCFAEARTGKGPLSAVDPAELQTVNGGIQIDPLPFPTNPRDPDEFCHTKPYPLPPVPFPPPHPPFPIIPLPLRGS